VSRVRTASVAPGLRLTGASPFEHRGVLVGERVEVHVLNAGQSPNLVATFGGRLQAGYSMTGGEPSDAGAIFVRLDAGGETAAISGSRVDLSRGECGDSALRRGTARSPREVSLSLSRESRSVSCVPRLEGQWIFADATGVTTVHLHAFIAPGDPAFCEFKGTALWAPNT
jgi:hypothetical protein